MTTWIPLGSISNSQRASITSSPLFIIVAESMVIFRPIFQFGCFSACATVTVCNRRSGVRRNGPPDAVRMSLSTSSRWLPCKHWKIALCSLSTGTRRTPFFLAVLTNISPAMTRASLLASAISFPASRPRRQGIKPAPPTIAASTMFTSGAEATAAAPASPKRISTLLLPIRRRNRGTSCSCWIAT